MSSAPAASANQRERLLLDFGWRFHLGHADDSAKDFGFAADAQSFSKSGGFTAPGGANFDDSSWQPVDLPHDWAVELPFENSKMLIQHGCKPLGRSYPGTSIGWYRRAFNIPAPDLGKRISLEFDGVFRNAMVIFNGHYIGENKCGYSPFRFDVTDFANYGSKNVLVLRVDATLNEGWFYEGAGIYRHVWLVKTHPIHVPQWGTFVRSEVSGASAAVSVTTEINNDSTRDSSCHVVSAILNADGTVVGSATTPSARTAAGQPYSFEQQIQVSQPKLWSIEEPYLYRLQTVVFADNVETDRYETTFGVRTIRFDVEQGLFLNGNHVKVKGTCNHQDHAGVGAALPDRLQYFRIERLKEMGSNAYRTSHNPPTPELLDACDRLGMIVMDETRMMSSNPEGMSQLERLVRRDRNRPCVFIWSLANEEREQGSERGARILTTTKALVRRLDPTRMVTAAMNNGWGKGISGVVDVQGCNYNDNGIDDFHTKFPQQPMIGTETASTVSTRGIYANDAEKGYVSAYDVNKPKWGALAEEWWGIYAARPFIAGGFVWTGFDYRGEPTPYGWPCINSHFGIMDTCGFPKDNYYYYQAWWGSKPVVHLFPHWNWTEGQEVEVWCHTNLQRVELFLNGKSLGEQPVKRSRHVMWKVTYAPGVIEAKASSDGGPALTDKRETTGPAARIALRADRPRINGDGEDVSVITVEVLDPQGRLVPTANHPIAFRVAGDGRLIGLGNGDPSSHELDKSDKRQAFNGLCQAIVQSSRKAGEITIEASSPGLQSGTLTVRSETVPLRPFVA